MNGYFKTLKNNEQRKNHQNHHHQYVHREKYQSPSQWPEALDSSPSGKKSVREQIMEENKILE